jgi:hypothetical protein
VASRRIAATALALVPAAVLLCAPVASADVRLADGPYFVKVRPSTRTTLVWRALNRRPHGRFQLLRGGVDGEMHVIAVLPALEGSHQYRYVDSQPPVAAETVYRLVYDDGAAQVVLLTARVVEDGLRTPCRARPEQRGDPLGT